MNGPLKLAHVTRGSQSTSTTSTTTTRPNPGWLGLITTFHPQGWATKEGTKEGHRSLGAYPRSADLARSDFVTPARMVSHIDGGYLHVVGNDNPRRHAIAWKLAASGVHELLEQSSLVHPGGVNRGQTHRIPSPPHRGRSKTIRRIVTAVVDPEDVHGSGTQAQAGRLRHDVAISCAARCPTPCSRLSPRPRYFQD